MHLDISWYVYPLFLFLAILLTIRLFQLPPRVKHMTAHDLAISAEYQNRLSRKGMHTPRNMAHVVDWRVEEKV